MAQVFFVVDRPNRVRKRFHHAVEGGFGVVKWLDRVVEWFNRVVGCFNRVEI